MSGQGISGDVASSTLYSNKALGQVGFECQMLVARLEVARAFLLDESVQLSEFDYDAAVGKAHRHVTRACPKRYQFQDVCLRNNVFQELRLTASTQLKS